MIDFKFLLQDVYGVKSPSGAPSYHLEYLFTCLTNEKKKGVSSDDIKKIAEGYWNALLTKFPYLEKKYGDIISDTSIEQEAREDGDIDFNQITNKYDLFFNNEAVVSCLTIDKAKRKGKHKFGLTKFNIISLKEEACLE